MGLAQRVALYKQLEEKRERPLIVYITSSRIGASGSMAADAIPELTDQVEKLPPNTKKLDLLVVSDGGDPMVAWRSVTLLRERVEHLTVLVPQGAYSAATLLALGANEIIMHPNGNLGPVDPQMSVRKRGDGEGEHFGFEDMTGFLEFVRKEVGLTDQEHIRSMFEMFCSQVGPVPVGVAARSSLLALSMGEKLLRMHMTGEANVQRPRVIAESLNKAFYHHGYPISRREAKDIGLPIADSLPEVEGLTWKIWLDVEKELEIRKPFHPVYVLMANAAAAESLLAPVPQLNIPPDAPDEVRQGLIAEMIGQGILEIEPVDFQFVSAVMESPRLASRDKFKGKIIACRTADLDLQTNVIGTETGWEAVEIPE